MSHARVILPDEQMSGGHDQPLSTLGVHGSPASLSLPSSNAAMSHMEAPPAAVNNDISSESNQHSCRLFVEFNASADHLDDSMKSHLRCFDAGANAENIFSKPGPTTDLSRAVMVSMELLQTSNSFPYAVALQFKGEGTDNLNTLGRRSGNRVAITMSPGENMRCNQVLYSPDATVRSSHFKDYAHCTKESIMSDIVPFAGKPWSYVPKDHPVIKIINKNASRLNLVLSDSDLQEGGAYYRVDREIIERVVEELHQNVLSKMPFVNLKQMKVNLVRADGSKFSSLAGSKLDGLPEKQAQAYLSKQNHCSAEFKVTYMFPRAPTSS